MIPNDWERIRTNFRPFLGEAAHWHRWPCEGASDSPRRGRRGPHGGSSVIGSPLFPMTDSYHLLSQWLMWLQHRWEVTEAQGVCMQRLKDAQSRDMMRHVETVHICSPPLFPTYSKQKGVPSMVFSCFPNVPRDLHGSSGIFWRYLIRPPGLGPASPAIGSIAPGRGCRWHSSHVIWTHSRHSGHSGHSRLPKHENGWRWLKMAEDKVLHGNLVQSCAIRWNA